MMFRRILLSLLLFFAPISLFAAVTPHSTPYTLLQLVSYVGADYGSSVKEGIVTDQSEYAEMVEFSGEIKSLIKQLPQVDPEVTQTLLQLADVLSDQVAQKKDPNDIYATTQGMSKLVIQTYRVQVNPPELPPKEEIAQIYQEKCSSCHGSAGAADGPVAKLQKPLPTNFTDRKHMDQLSIFALYNTITLGVPETGMAAFGDTLNDATRWGLAFYVGSLGIAPSALEEGKRIWESSPSLRANFSTMQITAESPRDLLKKYTLDVGPVIYYLLKNPEVVEKKNQDLWQITLTNLQTSFLRFQEQDYSAAYDLAVSAYLEGFEGLEPAIDVIDVGLRKKLEVEMLQYRELINKQASFDEVQIVFGILMQDLEKTQAIVSNSDMTWLKIFLSAFLILLREGLEMILVVALVATLLVKAGRRDALKYVHLGWITAIIAGIATWYASHTLINISGMQREMAEGLTALLAAAILFWVGFWLHTNTAAGQWQAFIKEKLGATLSRGSLLGLSGLCFIAVYREMFETILFYETLWLQAMHDPDHYAIYYGFFSALIVLFGTIFAIFRLGLKLPIQSFFTWSTRLIFVLAVMFIGQGIHALEEAGKVPQWSLDFIPTVSILGIYPNMLGLVLQALLIFFAWLVLTRDKQNKL